jgi:hypothetical protein
MPRIPGVADGASTPKPTESPASMQGSARSRQPGKSVLLSIALGVTLVLVGVVGWRALHFAGKRTQPPQEADEAPPEPLNLAPPPTPAAGPVTAASLQELAKPWAAKEFTYVDPATSDPVPAMVVHLAGEAPGSSSSYWAFSLAAPYQSCHLVYVTDLSELANRFSYQGTHPMVASPCDGTIYDPLKLGTIASGAWVRGEIVQGAGFRPPIAIEVKIQGGDLIADRIE